MKFENKMPKYTLVIIYMSIFLSIMAGCTLLMSIGMDGEYQDRFLLFWKIIWILWLLFFLIIAILNIISSIRLNINNKPYKLIEISKYFKIKLIPFLIMYICFLAFLYSYTEIDIEDIIRMENDFWGTIFEIKILPIIKMIYMIFISTIAYSISYIIYIIRKKWIKILTGILYIIIQLCFILDIINTIYLYNKYKKNE
jgi:hypothetical protein